MATSPLGRVDVVAEREGPMHAVLRPEDIHLANGDATGMLAYALFGSTRLLAVGDARFQKKCLGKMDEVAQAGRTILFVSHNMTAISRLCRRAI
jgi:hypothetical protein